MKQLFALLHELLHGCWLNHAWPEHPNSFDTQGRAIHICKRCGKRAVGF